MESSRSSSDLKKEAQHASDLGQIEDILDTEREMSQQSLSAHYRREAAKHPPRKAGSSFSVHVAQQKTNL